MATVIGPQNSTPKSAAADSPPPAGDRLHCVLPNGRTRLLISANEDKCTAPESLQFGSLCRPHRKDGLKTCPAAAFARSGLCALVGQRRIEAATGSAGSGSCVPRGRGWPRSGRGWTGLGRKRLPTASENENVDPVDCGGPCGPRGRAAEVSPARPPNPALRNLVGSEQSASIAQASRNLIRNSRV